MTKTRTSRVALAALLTLPVLALVGCAAADAEAPAPTAAAASTSTETAAEAVAAEDEEAGPVWPEDRCLDEQLDAEFTPRPDLSAAGQEGFEIVLTNVSEQSCSYFGGPPGVLFLDADGAILTGLGDAPVEPSPPGALDPGESGKVEGRLAEIPGHECTTTTTATTVRLLVTSDGAGPGVDAPAELHVCDHGWNDLWAGPFIPIL